MSKIKAILKILIDALFSIPEIILSVMLQNRIDEELLRLLEKSEISESSARLIDDYLTGKFDKNKSSLPLDNDKEL